MVEVGVDMADSLGRHSAEAHFGILMSGHSNATSSKLPGGTYAQENGDMVSLFVRLGTTMRSASGCWLCKPAYSEAFFLKSIEMEIWEGSDVLREPGKLPFCPECRHKTRQDYAFLLVQICVSKCIAKDGNETGSQVYRGWRKHATV